MYGFRIVLCLGLMLMPACVSAQWKHLSETNDQGVKLEIAEQIGDGGFNLSFVCSDMGTHVEVWIYDTETKRDPGATFLFSVDGRRPVRIGGFTERDGEDLLIFTGRDMRENPAAATPKLIRQLKQGSRVELVFKSDQSDDLLVFEEWSLKGSSKVLGKMEKQCEELQKK